MTAQNTLPSPPVALRIPQETTLHGVTLQDEYAWLRQKQDSRVIEYLQQENQYTQAILKPTEELQATLYQEMLGRIQQTDLTVPYLQDGFYYYTRTEEGKQYAIHCRKKGSLEAAEEILLDLNQLAAGHSFIALGVFAVSDDGRRLAYSLDFTGFRDFTLFVKDLQTRELLLERFEKSASAAWAADGRRLLYVLEDSAKRPCRVFLHTLGDLPASDTLLFEETDQRFTLRVERTRDKKILLLTSRSHTTSEVRFADAAQPDGEWTLISPRQQNIEYYAEHRGEDFYIWSNSAGVNFALYRTREGEPGRAHWQEVLPHRPEVMLEGAECFAGHLVLHEREDGLPWFRILYPETGESRRIPMPEPVFSANASENRQFDATNFRYSYQSLVTPPSVFEFDLTTGESELLKRTEVLGGFDSARYATARLHSTAPDGVQVPISLVYRRDQRGDAPMPLLLIGYGAYGVPYDVTFSSNRMSLLDRGFAIAIAHIRGGGEFGKAWHEAGRMAHKENTFADFVAAAEAVIAGGWTSPDRLMIQGGSAGGLLLGAVLNRRPELFRAAILLVPFVDIINTMLDDSLPLTVAEYEEWGNPRLPQDFARMLRYSPYDNVARQAYPAMLVRTSLNDSQVMFWEPAKYVARLRARKTDSNALLLHTNLAAGHGGSSGRYDRLREIAIEYAFLLMQAGIKQ